MQTDPANPTVYVGWILLFDAIIANICVYVLLFIQNFDKQTVAHTNRANEIKAAEIGSR